MLSLLVAAQASFPNAHLIVAGNPSGGRIALTFDAGADRGYAPQILALFERNKVHASFGMTGRWATANPDLVRRMAADGDTFINHTFDHRSFTGLSDHSAGLSPSQRADELRRTEYVVHRLTGRTTKPYFRPPFGDYDTATLHQVAQLGFRDIIMWTVDSLGWERVTTTAIVARCTALVRPGAIVLMHVGSQSNDYYSLTTLLKVWKQRHYRLVTVPQLLAN